MGTIDFLHGPGCSVDLVCRLPTMCINTDVLCLANGTLQKEGGSLFVSWGHLMRYLPRFPVDEKLCVFKLIRTSVYVCVCVCTHVYMCVYLRNVRKTDRDNTFKSQSET